MRKNIAIIGASYLQLPLIEKAKNMGYTTHVFAWKAFDVGEDSADFFYPISIIEKEEILEKCRSIGISGICSIGSDLASVTVNYVADKLGLTGNSISSSEMSTNKFLMRKAFERNGDPSTRCILIDDADTVGDVLPDDLKFPVIVKPTDRSGSRGVCKLDHSEGLRDAIFRAMSESFEKKALVEEFIEGREYSVEAISYHGEHKILAITLKYTTGAPNFIESGHMEPAPLDYQTSQRVHEVVLHALDSLEIENGASHSEVKISETGEIRIVEIGGRMGGDCIGSDLVQYSTGIDYVRAVIQIACGDKPDLSSYSDPIRVGIRFLLTPEDVQEMERVKESGQFVKMIAYFPCNIGSVTDSSNRGGCYIYRI